MYGADVTTFSGWGKAASGLPLRQCSRWSQRAHEHTSTRAHEHTSTRAHEHTSTRAHDTQPIPPQKNLTIRGNTSPATAQKYVTKTPRCASLPRHTATQAPTGGSIIPAAHTEARRTRHAAPQKTPTVGSIIPAAHTEARRTRHAAAQKTPRHEPARPNRRPLHPKNPCHPHVTEVDCTLSKHTGGFATIDPRHADDTPQSSAYGSNSPKPPTKTSHTTTTNRRRHAEHDPRHHTTSDIGNGLTH